MEKLKLLAYFAFDIESYNNINVIRKKTNIILELKTNKIRNFQIRKQISIDIRKWPKYVIKELKNKNMPINNITLTQN